MDYRGALHRDGSVLMSVTLDQLKVAFELYFLCLIALPSFFSLSVGCFVGRLVVGK